MNESPEFQAASRPCPNCGHPVLRPQQRNCSECGLTWSDWIDRHASRLLITRSTWIILLLVLPMVFSILPLLTARGAVVGARTFEASYLLTIPGFAGILFLSSFYARAIGWRLSRWFSADRPSPSPAPEDPPSTRWLVLGFLLLAILQALLFMVVVRLGFVLFVDPLRPAMPNAPGILFG